MKNQNLNNGKKLNKRELKMIKGGLLNCMRPIPCTEQPCEPAPPSSTKNCSQFSPDCAQEICRPKIIE